MNNYNRLWSGNTVQLVHTRPPWGKKKVAVVDRRKQESTYGLSAKKIGRCREVAVCWEVAVIEGPTVNMVKHTFFRWGAVKDKQFSWIIVMSMILPSGVWCLVSCTSGKLCNTISLIPLFNDTLLFRKKQKSPDTQTAQILASLLTAKKSEHWCSTTPSCTTLQFSRKPIIAIMKWLSAFGWRTETHHTVVMIT